MNWLFLVGRVAFASIFLTSGWNHLANSGMLAGYAQSKGVPAPRATVLVTGLMIVLGGLSILLGVRPQIGAVLIILFLLGTLVKMHNFWAITDANQRMIERIQWQKNLVMLGGALLIIYFTRLDPGAWVWSLRQ